MGKNPDHTIRFDRDRSEILGILDQYHIPISDRKSLAGVADSMTKISHRMSAYYQINDTLPNLLTRFYCATKLYNYELETGKTVTDAYFDKMVKDIQKR